MHPAGPPPPQNRSCPSPALAACPSPSPSLIQQQQQHVVYGPITTLQPCPATLHPHCIYTGVQRNPGLSGTSVPLTHQGTKWQPKSKPPRGHQQQQTHHHHHPQPHHHPQYRQPMTQQQVHQSLSYIPKPLVLFDQCPANQSTPGAPPPGTSFLVTSSTFANGHYGPGEPYSSAPGLTLIPQPYFKPPEVAQAFCLLPERPRPPHQHQQPLPSQNQPSYYNISAPNACNLPTITSKPGFQLTNAVNTYGHLTPFGGNHMSAGQTAPPNQIFQNPPMTLNFGPTPRDKLSMVANLDVQAVSCAGNLPIAGPTKQPHQHQQLVTSRPENVDWTVQAIQETAENTFEVPDCVKSPKVSSSVTSTNPTNSSAISKSLADERYSDESAASFDFTIEAEKMVSELCNTASSNDFGKDENHGRSDNSTSFSGAAGDNVTNKTNIWFADFCTEYGVSLGQNYRNTSTQTQDNKNDGHRCPESMRKTIYWGCNEAEIILNSDNHRCGSRAGWLGNISSATKTAVTKSSTCFPIFSDDRTFVEDLINALLRISNGWLVLDNYLNKQHYPSLGGKFDGDLTNRFQNWESSTNELLKDVVRTFVRIEENSVFDNSVGLESVGRRENNSSNSFPGDVCLYTNYDLFDASQRYQDNSVRTNTDDRNDRDSTYTLQYASQTTNHPNVRSFESQQPSPKETKLRSKWTITENLSSTIDNVKSVPDLSQTHNDPGFSVGNNRFRSKYVANPSNKIASATRHSLNAEFFHLRNKVMESMGNCSESERQRWGLKEHHYDFVFGSSGGSNPTTVVSGKNEPIYKIRTGGTAYENAWTRGCPSIMDSTAGTNQMTTSQCANVDGRVYVVSGVGTAMDSTYITSGPPAIRNKTYVEPDRTSAIADGSANCTGNNLRTTPISASTIVANVTTDPVYVGKSSGNQRELATVPRTKMTLLSQIEGNPPSGNRDTKEMTANLSAWFASIRNATAHRVINCPIEGRKNDNPATARTSSHPQETSRSAMDLNRQLHMDGNRQLQTLQNMQTIQSQPWNACNLLNNKRGSAKIPHPDEYDSSEDVRVYMKPGSYNVPKKRHHRKNNRRNDGNPATSRMTCHTPRGHNNRSVIAYNPSIAKNHQISTSVAALVISSSVQLSSTTTSTTTSVKIPFPATPVVPPPTNFSMDDSPGILRRVRSLTNHETRQDVAWKAACASAEILLEALNVKESAEAEKADSIGRDSTDDARDSREQRRDPEPRCPISKKTDKSPAESDVNGRSSYEPSEDDSDSTCKIPENSETREKSRDPKQPRTNVKTDFWLIRTLNNASIVSKIGNEETDGESTIDRSTNGSLTENRRDHQTVVTSTPEPVKNPTNENPSDSTVVAENLDDSFQERSTYESPRGCESPEISTSGSRQAPSTSLVDGTRDFVGRATYSETVRRSTGKCCSSGKKDSGRSKTTRSASFGGPAVRTSMLPVIGKKSQRRDGDRSSQTSRKSGKRLASNAEDKDGEEGFSKKRIVKADATDGNSTRASGANAQTRKKDETGSRSAESKWKPTDRGWSVWYSSRRRQTLSPLAVNKLSTIHRTVWQMEGAQVLKYPSASTSTVGAIPGSIEDYCKIIKSPMFLETIGYKLKNRIYHKVEHVIRDFRRIINNSKLYHKNDNDRIAEVDALSRKLEELFEEHFENWDFDNVLDSPRDVNTSATAQSLRYKSPQKRHKSAANRLAATAKRIPASSSKNEN